MSSDFALILINCCYIYSHGRADALVRGCLCIYGDFVVPPVVVRKALRCFAQLKIGVLVRVPLDGGGLYFSGVSFMRC